MTAAGIAVLAAMMAQAQVPDAPAQAEMTKLVESERAFVQRAQETNWRDAFLEYFADGMKGFEGEDVKERLRSRPVPPKEFEFWWEPRYGDIAASGELGWLTGPVRRSLPQVNSGKPDYSNYTSIWRRQPDGSYKVVEDVGISTPELPTFAPGFTRAPVASRYRGEEPTGVAKVSLAEADRKLNAALQHSQAAAYAAAAAPFARLHRQRTMPVVGGDAIAEWAGSLAAWMGSDTQLAIAADSGDLGYTRGSYVQGASAGAPPESGYYLRIWSRDSEGTWWLVLDITQPKS